MELENRVQGDRISEISTANDFSKLALNESIIFKDFSKLSKVFRNDFKTFGDFKPDLENKDFQSFF